MTDEHELKDMSIEDLVWLEACRQVGKDAPDGAAEMQYEYLMMLRENYGD